MAITVYIGKGTAHSTLGTRSREDAIAALWVLANSTPSEFASFHLGEWNDNGHMQGMPAPPYPRLVEKWTCHFTPVQPDYEFSDIEHLVTEGLNSVFEKLAKTTGGGMKTLDFIAEVARTAQDWAETCLESDVPPIEPPVDDYIVKWTMDVFEATSPRSAAQEALDSIKRDDSYCHVFDVLNQDGDLVELVDLNDEEEK